MQIAADRDFPIALLLFVRNRITSFVKVPKIKVHSMRDALESMVKYSGFQLSCSQMTCLRDVEVT